MDRIRAKSLKKKSLQIQHSSAGTYILCGKLHISYICGFIYIYTHTCIYTTHPGVCVCLFMYTMLMHTYIYIYVHIYICTHICKYMSVCMIYMHICRNIYTCLYTYVYLYTYIHVDACIYTHVYIHTCRCIRIIFDHSPRAFSGTALLHTLQIIWEASSPASLPSQVGFSQC